MSECKVCGKTIIMERPIIFSPEMVKAILEGKKTQTRRVMKPQPPDYIDKLCGPEFYEPAIIDKNGEIMPGEPIYGVYDYYSGEWGAKCPYGPGEILWVRETWAAQCDECEHNQGTGYDDATCAHGDCDCYVYRADYSGEPGGKWRPSIFMPKEACRLFLKVTNVRVERLQDITDDDAWKEGFERDFPFCEKTECDTCLDECSARYKFNKLWDNLNAKRGYGWETNPWVWVIEFERIAA